VLLKSSLSVKKGKRKTGSQGGQRKLLRVKRNTSQLPPEGGVGGKSRGDRCNDYLSGGERKKKVTGAPTTLASSAGGWQPMHEKSKKKESITEGEGVIHVVGKLKDDPVGTLNQKGVGAGSPKNLVLGGGVNAKLGGKRGGSKRDSCRANIERKGKLVQIDRGRQARRKKNKKKRPKGTVNVPPRGLHSALSRISQGNTPPRTT